MRTAIKVGILTTVLLLLVVPPSVSAANFKIKPLVVSGDSAPDGGTFTFISSFSMNNLGAVAFSGFTSISSGIYLTSNDRIQKVIKTGDSVIVPEMLLAGVLVKKEPNKFFPGVIDYEFSDGHRLSCNPTSQVGFNLDGALVNDNGDIVFRTGNAPLLLSGGTVSNLFGCPGVRHLLMDLNMEDPFAGDIDFTSLSALNNTGMIALKVFIRPFTTPRGLFGERHFLVTDGIPTLLPLVNTEAPGGGTIFVASFLALNDSGDALVFFNEQLFPVPQSRGFFIQSGASRTPVAITGQPALDGKTFFIDVQRAGDMNQAGEVVFVAQLSDLSGGIFRRAPDGSLILLVRRFSDAPGGSIFFNFFDVKVNDNGDVAFVTENGIFLRSANGGLSKVVRTGDSLPGIGTFTGFGVPQLTNKSQVAFFGFLSNGKSGIFLGAPGLETKFVDPVPDLLVGPTVTSDTTELAKNGRVVTGIAADGAAEVVVRVKTGQQGTVEFSLVESEADGAPSLPASNLNGALGQVGSATLSSMVSVPAVDVTGVGPMAFATYFAPIDFTDSPASVAAGLPDRQIFIKVKLTTSTGETVESTEPLKIVRPPVILVHGLWGSPGSWEGFEPLLSDSKFSDDRLSKQRIDYSGTNTASIANNAPQVGAELAEIIVSYKTKRQVAAIQADVITHSMGGLLARMLSLSADGFIREDNFLLGDIHKLINIATPHFGSELARLLRNDSCVDFFFSLSGNRTDQGAVEDLVPRSPVLNLINSLLSPLLLHNVIGIANQREIEASEDAFWLRVLRFLCPRSNLSGGLDAVHLNRLHDLVVDAPSQQGSISSASLVVNVIHTPVSGVFVGEGELESRVVSENIIRLLNFSLGAPTFTQFSPIFAP